MSSFISVLQGFQIPPDKLDITIPFEFKNKEEILSHGSVVMAAITSCTNTSNPSVMLGAGKSGIFIIFVF